MDNASPTDLDDAAPPSRDRLGSWKAIAAYVNRDVTTVQRWEKREGMPIHRHLHDKRGSVYAFRSELDAWMRDRRPQPEEEPGTGPRRKVPAAALIALAATALAGIGIVTWTLTKQPPAPRELPADARITPLTDFEGREQAAAISRDGKFVAFLSDREGAMDVWVTQVGTGQFINLTRGSAPELLNPEIRSVGFTPDDAMVTFWTRATGAAESVSIWGVPTLGGALREIRAGAVEMDWTRDGSRLVYHTAEPGDPTFVIDAQGGESHQIHVAPRGVHAHFQIWSPDERHIYFVRGVPPDNMDLWRMRPDGSNAERLTSHESWMGYPAFLDERTLFYLAATEDGAGPWLFALDVESRVSRRIGFGVEQYTSLAASADRRRWVATVEHAKTSLWRVPIADQVVDDRAASRIELPTVGGQAPRVGPDYLLFVANKNDGQGIWMLRDGEARELWSAPRTRVVGGPAIAPDGERFAFSAESSQGTRLYWLQPDGAGARPIGGDLEVRGAPAWSPDGRHLVVAAVSDGGAPRLFMVPLDGAPPRALNQGHALNPLWSSDGSFLVYSDADVGPSFALKAMHPDGSPRALSDITLPRGSRRVSFVPGRQMLVVLMGEMRHGNFWLLDLETGERRQLTAFGREFSIRDFDVSVDGREIVFDRRQENSDLALIELPTAQD
jgi:Tol biopolymer transport system component